MATRKPVEIEGGTIENLARFGDLYHRLIMCEDMDERDVLQDELWAAAVRVLEREPIRTDIHQRRHLLQALRHPQYAMEVARDRPAGHGPKRTIIGRLPIAWNGKAGGSVVMLTLSCHHTKRVKKSAEPKGKETTCTECRDV